MKHVIFQSCKFQSCKFSYPAGLVSGQETERAYSYNSGAHTGLITEGQTDKQTNKHAYSEADTGD